VGRRPGRPLRPGDTLSVCLIANTADKGAASCCSAPSTRTLASQIGGIVQDEGPIHRDLLTDRLKEINRVGRVGSNVESNIGQALALALREGQMEAVRDVFLRPRGRPAVTFRQPSDGVERRFAWIPPEEVQLAVLHVVEDQFSCRREALPRAVAGLFGLERAQTGVAEAVGTAVERSRNGGTLLPGAATPSRRIPSSTPVAAVDRIASAGIADPRRLRGGSRTDERSPFG
jgi:hypothetical protein